MTSLLDPCERYNTDMALLGAVLVGLGTLVSWPPALDYKLGELFIWVGGSLFIVGGFTDVVLTHRKEIINRFYTLSE